MQPHEERVVVEKKELDEKIMKLNTFIISNKIFQELSEDDKDLLEAQRVAMEEYSEILGHRIHRFNS